MSLDNKRLKSFKKDEKMATKEYADAARQSKDREVKNMFKEMSRDEAKHARYIERMLKLNKEYKKRERNGSKKHQFQTFIFDDVDD